MQLNKSVSSDTSRPDSVETKEDPDSPFMDQETVHNLHKVQIPKQSDYLLKPQI